MSLINDMLKDLDKRRSRQLTTPPGKADFTELVSPPESAPRRFSQDTLKFYLAVVIGFFVLVGIIWAIIPAKEKAKVEDKVAAVVNFTPKTATQPSTEVTVQPVEQPFANQATLSDITSSIAGKEVDLALRMSAPVHYQVYRENKGTSVRIILDNLLLSSDFKNEVEENNVVKSVKTRKYHDDLELIIKVDADAVLEELSYDDDTLNIRFSHPTMDVVVPQKEAPAPVDSSVASQQPAASQQPIVSQQPSETKIVPVQLTRAERMKIAYDKILDLIDQGQTASAISELKHFVAQFPDFLPARKALIVSLLQAQQTNDARQYLNQGLVNSPGAIDLIIIKAKMLADQGNDQSALQLLQSYSPTIESAPEYYSLMAGLQQRQGNYQIAVQLYSQLLNYQPSNSLWWMGLGVALESLGNNNRSIDAYQKAISTGKLSPTLQAYVASRLQRLGA